MKSVSFKLHSALLAAVILFSTSVCFGAQFTDGHGEGNGGDAYAAEWTARAHMLYQDLKKLRPEERLGLDLRALRGAIISTHVISTEEPLQHDGELVDALNFPEERRIEFSRQRWDALAGSPVAFAREYGLILHEYLDVIGMNDEGYRISSRIMMSLGYGRGPEPRF
jgi:hypothetical protein